MKTLDLSNDAKSPTSFQSCEIKTQKGLTSETFFRLNSNFNLNSKFKTPNVKAHNLTKDDFYKALSTDVMFDNDKFVCLINNCLVGEDKAFSENDSIIRASKVDSNQFERHSGSVNEFFATLLENLSCERKDRKVANSPAANQLDSIYELTGVSNLLVLFHKNFSIRYIKKLLIYDLMRSLYARIRLLVEDLDARKDIIGDAQLDDPNSNDVSAIEESYQTPNRIHIQLTPQLVISDYVFPDENELDIKMRIKEIYNVEINDCGKQIFYAEELPPEIRSNQSDDVNEKSDLSSSISSNQVSSAKKQNLKTASNSNCNII